MAGLALLAASSLAACSSGSKSDDPELPVPQGLQVGVILPDSDPSQRFGSEDPKFLASAFTSAGLSYTIQYAQNDSARFLDLARALVKSGIKVLAIVNPDSDSGRAAITLAHAANIKAIDYDRLSLNGGADYYVSFDSAAVGKMQADGLVQCLEDKGYNNPVVAELNGSQTDHNATLLKGGSDAVLQPRYDDALDRKGPDQWVPDWDVVKAEQIFAQMLDQQPLIRGVLAANDGLAGAAIKVLRQKKLAGTVPVTGQDATLAGVRNVLAGDQCMTVYKPIVAEAQALATVAAAAIRGQDPGGLAGFTDPVSGAHVPARLLQPTAINRTNIGTLFDAKFITRQQLCAGGYERLCKAWEKEQESK